MLPFFFFFISGQISRSQPCHCDHTITAQQLSVSGTTLGVQPGDTICLMAGIRDYLSLSDFHGDSLHPVIMINCGGAVVVSNNYYMYGIKLSSSVFFRFTGSGVDSIKYGIRVMQTAPGTNGISFDNFTSNFEADHLEVANTGFAGIVSKTDPKCDLSSNRGNYTQFHTSFHDNYVHNTGGEGFYIGHSFYSGFVTTCNGVTDTLYPHEIKGLRIFNNLVENTRWDGIQVGCATEDCEIYSNIVNGYGLDGVVAQNSGIQIGGGTTGKCYNNLVSNGTGTGIMVFGTGNNQIFNNLVHHIGLTFFPADPSKRVYGIFVDDRSTVPGRSFDLINNTIARVKTDGIRFFSLQSSNNKIYNNLIVHPGSLGAYSADSQSYIYLLPGVDVTLKNNFRGATMQSAAFRDTLQGNYRLRAASPARDSGTDVSYAGISFDCDSLPRPYNWLFDIGAYEYRDENSWTGSVSPSWSDPGNWSKQDQPNTDDHVVIQGGTPFQPVIAAGSLNCHHLTLEPDSALLIEPGALLTVSGNLIIQQGGVLDNRGVLHIHGNLFNQNP